MGNKKRMKNVSNKNDTRYFNENDFDLIPLINPLEIRVTDWLLLETG